MTVRWLRPVGEGSRISHAFADIDREAAFEEIEPVASGGRWPVTELLPELAGPATHGRPGGRNPSLVRSSNVYGKNH